MALRKHNCHPDLGEVAINVLKTKCRVRSLSTSGSGRMSSLPGQLREVAAGFAVNYLSPKKRVKTIQYKTSTCG